ncbi:hypothetical protein AtubIFM54640_006069 [Aspergillus tubingensis]|uniref:Heterokaryon incompatibility domain-containing protein n=1 Tax=Aspergillus niger TaxID=5061 RepID=A0A100I5T7_ASPNG|nr:hypothetical protein ANI_1_2614024 [Aspergillus niger]GLA64351.1 hypothetical protein AtubIFM54640_006069 [Aspergillus tubingensis]
MPVFEYLPLDQGPFSTRILRLLPSKDRAAPIKCQLFNYSLQDEIAQEYDALSYVWGDQTDGQSNISINNQAFSVGKNLHSALLRLRGFEFERTLWVDAICIDQNNIREKEKQIQNMARIYEQARQVVVWLGEEADNSTQALESIRAAAEAGFAEEQFHMPSESATIEGVKSLFLRRWFYRMWILQEVGLARNIQIQCGPVKMSGYAFATGMEAYRSYAGPSVMSTTHLIRGAIFRPQYEMHPMKKLSLSELIDMHHTNEASILHDKIFALLGLSSESHKVPGLLPNYQVPWEQLFQRLVRFILNEQVSVKTWPGREYASIQSSGWILGFIVKAEDYHTKTLLQVLLTGVCNADTKKMWKVKWFIRKIVESIKPCDIICLLQGCSEPSIIRYADGCFRVIMLRAVLRKTAGGGSAEFQQVRSENNRPALNFHLIWSWEEHMSPSSNILDLAAEAVETKSAIEKILWDTNVAMHETAYNYRNIYLPAMFATEDILRLFTERLGYRHPKTRLALYSVALLYSKGNIGDKIIPVINFDRTKARDILRRVCGIQERKDFALLVGHDYRRRMYINEPDFISGSMEVPERVRLQEVLKDLLREIKHRPTLELAPLF